MSSVTQGSPASKATRTTRRNISSASSARVEPSLSQRSDIEKTGPLTEQNQSKSVTDVSNKRPAKRRKVNHACVYCRRSHMTCDQGRPCSRCIKRNIPHLCHDEPRESKKSRGDSDKDQVEATSPTQQSEDQIARNSSAGLLPSEQPSQSLNQESLVPPAVATNPDMIQCGGQAQSYNVNNLLFNDFSNIPQDQLQGIQSHALSSMFSNPELNSEYNLLNNFLASSLLDDGAFYQGENPQNQFSDPSFANIMGPLSTTPAPMQNTNGTYAQVGPSANTNGDNATPRPTSKKQSSNVDKAQEKYYLTAADPSGVESAEERMNKLLKAKYEAGLLKPFNYVKGYARLNHYMERNLQARSRQKILRQLEIFRPKFRERMQSLTDVELVLVEIWFERKLMEYDRVFASMAVPACCWRRTGEIFRGNRAMAELIGVSIERLRDGKISIHEIIVEDSLVGYWEKFGSIAFDDTQKGILTSCGLKNPDETASKDTEVKCCFSFMIQRDTHSIPSMIIGNFLPLAPPKG